MRLPCLILVPLLSYGIASYAHIYKCHSTGSSVYVYANGIQPSKQCVLVKEHLSKIPVAMMRGAETSSHHMARLDDHLKHDMLTEMPSYRVGSQIPPAVQQKFDSRREEILKRELYQESVALLEVIKKIEAYWRQEPGRRDTIVYRKLIDQKDEHDENIRALRQEIAHVDQMIRKPVR